ncbi:hypothetical protein MKW92_034693 [Papaver armeniacum]|nr:hypothetical protein MKW92_034693 [Papaver armeniacum]
MTEVEREALLEKQPESREQLPTTTQFRKQDPEVGTSTTKLDTCTSYFKTNSSNGCHEARTT